MIRENFGMNCIIPWTIQFVKFFTNKNYRFLMLSLPFFSTQVIYDRQNKKKIKVKIREFQDWKTTTQIFYHNDYGIEKLSSRFIELENNYKQLLNNNLKPLIIDCGGNIGLATRYFIETYPDSEVICIEPEHNNILLAKENNPHGNITFFEAAIGNSDTRGSIINPDAGNNAFRVNNDENGGLEILSIDTILKNSTDKNLRPFIIKIDIEGFESDLFSDNTEWIDQFPILIIELHDWMLPKTANSNNFLKEISKLNRDFLFFGENVFSISNRLFFNSYVDIMSLDQ